MRLEGELALARRDRIEGSKDCSPEMMTPPQVITKPALLSRGLELGAQCLLDHGSYSFGSTVPSIEADAM